MQPFNENVIAFLNELSAALLREPSAKAYPDVITFAFFCRKANLERLRLNYDDLSARLGRGLTFHIAPSNVPVNFAYSMIAGLLAGNACVVKASSKDFAQTRIICQKADELLQSSYADLRDCVNVIMYPREAEDITAEFSAKCAVRVIWGGDETVQRVRKAALAPRSSEITFADRYSILCANADGVLQMTDDAMERAMRDFYNDTWLTDQNACTSPRLIYWLGNKEAVQAAQQRFWAHVQTYMKARYTVTPVMAVDKLTMACRAAIDLNAKMSAADDVTAVRMRLNSLSESVQDYRTAGGFFPEYSAETLDDLKAIINPRVQTLSHFGFADDQPLRDWVIREGLTGIDRICAMGHTMDFALIWDGHDLIREMSRRIG